MLGLGRKRSKMLAPVIGIQLEGQPKHSEEPTGALPQFHFGRRISISVKTLLRQALPRVPSRGHRCPH